MDKDKLSMSDQHHHMNAKEHTSLQGSVVPSAKEVSSMSSTQAQVSSILFTRDVELAQKGNQGL